MTTLQMIIVTGGYDGSQDVASTEVMDYSGEQDLKIAIGQLPKDTLSSPNPISFPSIAYTRRHGMEQSWRASLC